MPDLAPRHDHDTAWDAAEYWADILRAACTQVEIAGSLRRKKRQVKDIEIVAEARIETDLFGGSKSGPWEIDRLVEGHLFAGKLSHRMPRRMGERYKALVDVESGIAIDLFVVRPPARWGAILAIRTGPATFSKELVTAARRRGRRVVDGRLIIEATGATIETPTEESFFRACGVEWREPEARR